MRKIIYLMVLTLCLSTLVGCKRKDTKPVFDTEVSANGIHTEVSGNSVGYSEQADIYAPQHQSNDEYLSDDLPYNKKDVIIAGIKFTGNSTRDDFDSLPGYSVMYEDAQDDVTCVCFTNSLNVLLVTFGEDNIVRSIYTNINCFEGLSDTANEQEIYDTFGFPYSRSTQAGNIIQLMYANTEQSSFVNFTLENDQLKYTLIQFVV